MDDGKDAGRLARGRDAMLKLHLRDRGITDSGVLKAMYEVLREEFIPESYRSQAYADGPLPIGMGQTISQPYIVALMTQELRLRPDCEVLEIGTGSGYQTAILSRLVKKVYTAEKFGELSESAQAVLARLGMVNIEFFVGDGSCGWPERRTFDRIIVTAAVPKIPDELTEQLVDEGIMVSPVGESQVQELVVCVKKAGKLAKKKICDVRFVPLVGRCGFEE